MLLFGGCFVAQNKTSAEETQHAVCKIVTNELQATANVTLTRELKGVCTSSEINRKFEELQNVLLKELQLIRRELKENEIAVSDEDYQYQNSPEIRIEKRTVYTANTFNRKAEISKYNVTINSSLKGTYFYYYWQIENINEILSDTRGISIRSPTFTLLGNYHFANHSNPSCKFFLRAKLSYCTLSASHDIKILGHTVERCRQCFSETQVHNCRSRISQRGFKFTVVG